MRTRCGAGRRGCAEQGGRGRGEDPRRGAVGRAKGEVFEIKTLIKHPMDNGSCSRGAASASRGHIIHRFEALYNGALVFRADWHEAVSTNPFISFHAVAEESGQIEFRWYDDDGAVYTESADIEVS